MRIFATLLALAMAGSAQAQSTAPTPRSVMRTTGAFLALSVADLEASSRWYEEKLGLALTMDVPAGEHPAVRVLEGGGLIVELVQHPRATSLAGDRMLLHGLVKAGMIVEDFDAVVATLRSRNVEIVLGPFPSRGSLRSNVLIRDNSGNLIQVFGP